MGEISKIMPQVRISPDEMQAFLLLPMLEEHNYREREVLDILYKAGVTYGIKENTLRKMIAGKFYDQEFLIAEGMPAAAGTDGYFEYHFNTQPDGKPVVRADGSVDYWSIQKVEMVHEGQVIVTYHPAVQGTDGVSVKGRPLYLKPARELPPLKGKGFTRSADNLTYRANFEGKVELVNDRIFVSQVYEISGDADLSVGNIDFVGDVVIHGNVCSGIKVKASGSITVDGIVEAADLWAAKDIVLRGGMMGEGKSTVFAKGNISAKFFEYTTVEAWEEIQAEVFLNCQVSCRRRIVLSGKKAAVIGGNVYAVQGIETGSLGNEVEIRTDVRVGNDVAVGRRVRELQKSIQEKQELLERIEKGLVEFAKLEAAHAVEKNDSRKVQLLRVKVRETALLGADQAELNKLEQQIESARNAGVKVMRAAHPGVRITIDDVKYYVRDIQQFVEYKKYKGEIVRYPVIA